MKITHTFSVAFVLGSLLTFTAGCGGGTPSTAPTEASAPTIPVAIDGHAFKLEVADDEAEREKGLMNRPTMPIDHGMLFVFPDSKPRAFWMKNTLLPLDIAFLDADGTVLNVEQMYPKDLTSIPSRGPAKYAIELNQGVAKEIGLKAGDRISLPATSANPAAPATRP